MPAGSAATRVGARSERERGQPGAGSDNVMSKNRSDTTESGLPGRSFALPRSDKLSHLPADLPVIDADRCVHAIVSNASCQDCVDACPRAAWVLEEDALGFDEQACDGCGICVPVCPQTAIELPLANAARSYDDDKIGLFACSVAVEEGGPGVRPCLNSIGIDELAQLYAQGLRQLIVSREACLSCERGLSHQFDQAVINLQRLWADRGMDEFSITEYTPGEWHTIRSTTMRASRRGFFVAVSRLVDVDSNLKTQRQVPAAERLPAGESGMPLNPYLPEIDTANCVGCNACIRICPTHAITLVTDHAGRPAYKIAPSHCTGCRLCADVCDTDAVAVKSWQRGDPTSIQLDSAQCRSCGTVFLMPESQGSAELRCRICLKTQHYDKLFQVLR